MPLPKGNILVSEPGTRATFLFDCRSIPPPRPNLVYIFEGVCNRSGFLSAPGGSPPAVRGCPVAECPYNVVDDAQLKSIRDRYHMVPVANLSTEAKPVASPTDPDTRFRVRCLVCRVVNLYALDENPGEGSRPLRECPYCCAAIPPRNGPLTWSLDPAESHGFLWLSFAPPATQGEAERVANEAALDLGQPVCDLDTFFPGANLDKQDLSKKNLFFAKLARASLRGAKLDRVALVGAELNQADFTDASLTLADLHKVTADGALFRQAKMTEASAVAASFQMADFRRALMKDAAFSMADLSGAVLAGADLTGANLDEARLVGADLSGAILRGASLVKANLEGANLTGADLTDAVLEEAILSHVTAPWASWKRAMLKLSVAPEADFSRGDFAGTRIDGANWTRTTLYRSKLVGLSALGAVLEFSDLRECTIENCTFIRSSLRGADFRSASVRSSNFDGADVTWIRVEKAEFSGNRPDNPRPSKNEPVFSPGVDRPLIEEKPRYRLPADESDRASSQKGGELVGGDRGEHPL